MVDAKRYEETIQGSSRDEIYGMARQEQDKVKKLSSFLSHLCRRSSQRPPSLSISQTDDNNNTHSPQDSFLAVFPWLQNFVYIPNSPSRITKIAKKQKKVKQVRKVKHKKRDSRRDSMSVYSLGIFSRKRDRHKYPLKHRR